MHIQLVVDRKPRRYGVFRVKVEGYRYPPIKFGEIYATYGKKMVPIDGTGNNSTTPNEPGIRDSTRVRHENKFNSTGDIENDRHLLRRQTGAPS